MSHPSRGTLGKSRDSHQQQRKNESGSRQTPKAQECGSEAGRSEDQLSDCATTIWQVQSHGHNNGLIPTLVQQKQSLKVTDRREQVTATPKAAQKMGTKPKHFVPHARQSTGEDLWGGKRSETQTEITKMSMQRRKSPSEVFASSERCELQSVSTTPQPGTSSGQVCPEHHG